MNIVIKQEQVKDYKIICVRCELRSKGYFKPNITALFRRKASFETKKRMCEVTFPLNRPNPCYRSPLMSAPTLTPLPNALSNIPAQVGESTF